MRDDKCDWSKFLLRFLNFFYLFYLMEDFSLWNWDFLEIFFGGGWIEDDFTAKWRHEHRQQRCNLLRWPRDEFFGALASNKLIRMLCFTQSIQEERQVVLIIQTIGFYLEIKTSFRFSAIRSDFVFQLTMRDLSLFLHRSGGIKGIFPILTS